MSSAVRDLAPRRLVQLPHALEQRAEARAGLRGDREHGRVVHEAQPVRDARAHRRRRARSRAARSHLFASTSAGDAAIARESPDARVLIGAALVGVDEQERHVGALERAHGHQRADVLGGLAAPARPPQPRRVDSV